MVKISPETPSLKPGAAASASRMGRHLATRGNQLRKEGRIEKAIQAYEAALKHIPDNAGVHNNLGNAYRDLGQLKDAVASYGRALALKPDLFAAHYNLGLIWMRMGKDDAAIRSLGRAHDLNPDHTQTSVKLARLLSGICDWTPLDITGRGLAADDPVNPSVFLHLEDAPDKHLVRARNYSASTYKRPLEAPSYRTKVSDRLRIGYFSADFCNHPVMFLMARIFELHDRDRFEVTAFSHGPDRKDGMRSRLRAGIEQFEDISRLNDVRVAELARSRGLDIAVDLMGHTADSRLQLFANRLAPVQISFLGYPGTTGAEFMDYLVADRVVVPDHLRRHYSESILYLPNSLMPTDDRREISTRRFTRDELGLPDSGFVFCCFNNNKKIRPEEFDIWMRLLRRVDGSVLWLFGSAAAAESNLRAEAAKRGVAPERLIFAGRLPENADHLARIGCADLFLDTFNWNAHATTVDALWAGLPVLTRLGRSFSARVAGSLLTSAGLDELVTDSNEAYERRALDLAMNPDRLAGIRQRLADTRSTSPLFDSERFTRDLESAYAKAFELHRSNHAPRTIYVSGPDR